jgi:hypothetical protein
MSDELSLLDGDCRTFRRSPAPLVRYLNGAHQGEQPVTSDPPSLLARVNGRGTLPRSPQGPAATHRQETTLRGPISKIACGCSSVVERHVANVNVVGSNPITRFQCHESLI